MITVGLYNNGAAISIRLACFTHQNDSKRTKINDFNVKIITEFLMMGLKGHPLTNHTRRGFDPAHAALDQWYPYDENPAQH